MLNSAVLGNARWLKVFGLRFSAMSLYFSNTGRDERMSATRITATIAARMLYVRAGLVGGGRGPRASGTGGEGGAGAGAGGGARAGAGPPGAVETADRAGAGPAEYLAGAATGGTFARPHSSRSGPNRSFVGGLG